MSMTWIAETTHSRAQQKISWDLISTVSLLRSQVGFFQHFKILKCTKKRKEREAKRAYFVFFEILHIPRQIILLNCHENLILLKGSTIVRSWSVLLLRLTVDCLRADVSYFLCWTRKRDVCVTPSLIVF